jgi:cardiolipin synthase A/B
VSATSFVSHAQARRPEQAEEAQRSASRWTDGNAFQLLENGEEFFPRVFDCIARAQQEVLVETFILFEDKVGKQLHASLLAAAKRGVQVDLTIDGFGSPDLSGDFIGQLCQAGVRVHVFDPAPRVVGWRTNWLRRMHRKIVVVDASVAFVGGINYSADHLADFGPEAKQDYSMEIQGPLVAEIHRFAHTALVKGQRREPGRRWFRGRSRLRARPEDLPPAGDAQGLFVTRDNNDHQDDIERHYRVAIRAARQRVVIANAYFFPGYRLLKELRRAAKRGVDVRLILQGQPDMPIVKTAASMLYHHLVKSGVRIYEYCDRPLHGKVALVDDRWSTVGSSNLDPLSLSLNLEANVIVRDRAFNETLYSKLDDLMRNSCKRVNEEELGPLNTWGLVRSYFVFHAVRLYPRLAGWLPTHIPRLADAGSEQLTEACPRNGGARTDAA